MNGTAVGNGPLSLSLTGKEIVLSAKRTGALGDKEGKGRREHRGQKRGYVRERDLSPAWKGERKEGVVVLLGKTKERRSEG